MKKIKRSACLLTGVEDIEPIYSFKKFPVYLGCTNTPSSKDDLFADMNWGCSKSSGSLQLMDLLDPDILYAAHHDPGVVGKIWQDHHETFSKFIKKYGFKNVLEIGGASGTLVKHFLSEKDNFNWTIIEPSDQKSITDNRVNYLKAYFEDFSFQNKFDTIVHSHVFEHVYHPLSFLKKVNELLEYGDRHYISLPNLKYWLEQGYTNALMFEHTFYVDEIVLKYLLDKSGFKIIDKISSPHSLMIYCAKTNKNVDNTITNFSYIKDLYLKYVNDLIENTRQIKDAVGNNNFYLFGAHVFSQTLINLGLPESQIINILDNNPKKQNLRLYGTNLYVKSPECLKGVDSPIVVVRSGAYTDEIKNAILNINPTVIFY